MSRRETSFPITTNDFSATNFIQKEKIHESNNRISLTSTRVVAPALVSSSSDHVKFGDIYYRYDKDSRVLIPVGAVDPLSGHLTLKAAGDLTPAVVVKSFKPYLTKPDQLIICFYHFKQSKLRFTLKFTFSC